MGETKRQRLRAEVAELSGGRCDWPYCDERGVELAHIRSIGMGGRGSADEIGNCMFACKDHARISDGEFGAGGNIQYVAEHHKLWAGAGVGPGEYGSVAWWRAEALTRWVAKRRRMR